MKNKAAKQKLKKKGSENAFGCDLNEHLQNSGHEVPHVLKTCAEFIEQHGIVDGIYRLSGITSNIQRLRQEFNSEQSPDLTKEVYLQDIHCVGSLCKLYFRELPNPLLTYELYQKFTEAVSVTEEHEQLRNVQRVIEELPTAHFRTLEYLAKHLAHLATLSHQTNMHTRNLALVWAPNLLRSKEIEVSVCNGDEAFLEVRVQQSVVEFILNHTEQIFNNAAETPRPKEGAAVKCVEKYATLPAISQCPPMKLMSLEEAQARSLGQNHLARIERQRENSLPDTSTTAMYHTVIELSESKRKFSGKSKKWKSIFSLGRSDTKGKLSRNGSMFMRGQNVSEKTGIRPSKSMDSLCSLPTDEDRATSPGANGFFAPVVKSRTLGSDINYDPSDQDPNWEFDLRKASGVIGGNSSSKSRRTVNAASSSSSLTPSSSTLQRALPEQLKVFKGDELTACRPTSPKNRRMLYSGSSNNGSSRPSFPGSLFPLESSPRHQRKALNISEPFAVSVPLRVSAVISSNSTPCRVAGKERECSLGSLLKANESTGLRETLPSNRGSFDLRDKERPFGGRENPPGNSSGHCIYSNSSSVPIEGSQALERGNGVIPSSRVAECKGTKVKELFASVEVQTQPKTRETKEDMPQPSGTELDAKPMQLSKTKKLEQLDTKSANQELWSNMHQELNITEPDTNMLKDQLKDQLKASGSMSKITGNNGALNLNVQAKRRSSLPTHTVSTKEHFKDTIKGLAVDHAGAALFNPTPIASAENISKNEDDWNCLDSTDKKVYKSLDTFESLNIVGDKLQLSPFIHLKETAILQDAEPWPSVFSTEDPFVNSVKKNGDASISDIESFGESAALSSDKNAQLTKENYSEKKNIKVKDKLGNVVSTAKAKRNMERFSKCLDEQHLITEIPCLDDDDVWESQLAGLDQVEPWEDLSTTQEWVTSPLHTTKLEDLFPLFTTQLPNSITESEAPFDFSTSSVQKDMTAAEEPALKLQVNSGTQGKHDPALLSLSSTDKQLPTEESDLAKIFVDAKFETKKAETKQEIAQLAPFKSLVHQEELTRMAKRNSTTPKQKSSTPSQRFFRQISHEPCIAEKNEENFTPKHRPYSLNLDMGHRCIRDISNQQNFDLAELSAYQRGAVTPIHDGLSVELEMFLRDRQAPMRRNSAPVSVSSVRTAFMIKTCQAKAVPVIPPKIQYSQIPHSALEKDTIQEQEKVINGSESEGGPEKVKLEKSDPLVHHMLNDPKEERENCKPVPKIQRQVSMEKPLDTCKPIPPLEFPVLRRKRSANTDSPIECPRPERSTLHQRSSFRNRPRPQSLILFSPPFPIMDYHPAGDDGKLVLSPIKSPIETSPLDILSNNLSENLKSPEGVTLRNKMTLPKSGQRLETSTSCFYQPQRRSMIFDNRSNRQIE